MILAIDVGNISTTIALLTSQGEPVFRSILNTDPKMTDDRCAIDLYAVCHLHGADPKQIEGSVLSCVVPSIQGVYIRTLRTMVGRPPLVVGAGIRTGLNIRAEVHNQLGSDIVATAVAAAALYPSPVVVIHCRTAVTFSYLNKEVFQGCAIMPGIDIALEALSRNGAQLPQISLERVENPLGRNTVDSMRAGLLYGYSGAFDRLIEELEQAAGAKAATVVATGGEYPELYRLCRRDIRYDRDLLVKGLWLLYRKNTERSRRG